VSARASLAVAGGWRTAPLFAPLHPCAAAPIAWCECVPEVTWRMEVPLTPLALVERGLTLYPDRAAVVDDAGVRTYAQLADRLGRLAAAVRRLGVGPGERVALLAPNTAQALECYSGVPFAGAVLVPLNTRLAPEELAYILRHSEARTLFLDAALWPAAERALPGRNLPLVVMGEGERPPEAVGYEELLASTSPLALDAEAVDERAPVTLNYTSGTTARPKGVAVTHRGACLNAANMVFALGLRREDVHLHVAPMFHANGWGLVPFRKP
jgi:fatty-acyl-CoA synthase